MFSSHEMDYRTVYTEHGSYLALVSEPVKKDSSDFWCEVRQGVAAAIALPLTLVSYLF